MDRPEMAAGLPDGLRCVLTLEVTDREAGHLAEEEGRMGEIVGDVVGDEHLRGWDAETSRPLTGPGLEPEGVPETGLQDHIAGGQGELHDEVVRMVDVGADLVGLRAEAPTREGSEFGFVDVGESHPRHRGMTGESSEPGCSGRPDVRVSGGREGVRRAGVHRVLGEGGPLPDDVADAETRPRVGQSRGAELVRPDDPHAERLAKGLGKSRSELYREAVSEYLARHEPESVTQAINEVCDDLGTEQDPGLREAARRTLGQVEW